MLLVNWTPEHEIGLLDFIDVIHRQTPQFALID